MQFSWQVTRVCFLPKKHNDVVGLALRHGTSVTVLSGSRRDSLLKTHESQLSKLIFHLPTLQLPMLYCFACLSAAILTPQEIEP